MTIFSLVASHRTVDLRTVADLASGAQLLNPDSLTEKVSGMVILSTCNRLEIYGEYDSGSGATTQKIELDVNRVATAIFTQLATLSNLPFDVVESSFEVLYNEQVAHHLFTVASGLESAVVGESEITGQVRRAITTAHENGVASGNLVRLFDQAANTAKRVGQQTMLRSRGRSIVSVALDLADEVAEGQWPERRALIFGTGSYAGATVAALTRRECRNISVFSYSNRAATFADKRSITPIQPEDLPQALAEADIIIGCSGSSAPLAASAIPAGKHIILDLALSRDFAPEIADLPNVELITLESVRLAAPQETDRAVTLARSIVDSAAAEYSVKEKARTVDAAIVALREHTLSILDSELDKVRNQFGCGAAADQMEFAMRRMVKSLLHTPTVRARTLAQEGREDEYIAALDALYGIAVEAEHPSEQDRPANAS